MSNQIPESNRREVYDRADRRCEQCGNPQGVQIHHIIPRRNRIHRTETLILLCNRCHRLAHEGELGHRLKLKLQQHYRFKGYEGEQLRRLMGGRLYTRKEVE